MGLFLGVVDTVNRGRHTETAATAIEETIVPRRGQRTRLTKLLYTPGATSHILRPMVPFGYTTLSAAALASQAVINLTADPGVAGAYSWVTETAPGAIAASDYLLIEKPDNTLHRGIVSSVSTLAITLTANVPTGGFNSGARVWFLGAPTDHMRIDLTTGAQRTIQDDVGGFARCYRDEDPMLVWIDNLTNAGVLDLLTACYTVAAAA